MNTRSFVLAALGAGVIMAVLGNLPVVNLLNGLLCFWVWVGGVLAVLLYRRFEQGKSSLTPAQGAGIGALAGLVGAIVGLLLFPLTSAITSPLFASVARALQIEGDLPFTTSEAGSPMRSTLIFFVVDVILYPLFGAISGFVATKLLVREPQRVR